MRESQPDSTDIQNILCFGRHEVVIQTGVLSPAQPVGRPLIITIFFTPSCCASSNVFW